VGKSVVIIANLEPRMMMGMESNGMLLAAHGEGGAPVLIQPVSDVPPGAKIS
jgi:tRNA-binding EMAP/Myf-like protein